MVAVGKAVLAAQALAKVVAEVTPELTQPDENRTDLLMGLFMANFEKIHPEMAGESDVDHYADVFREWYARGKSSPTTGEIEVTVSVERDFGAVRVKFGYSTMTVRTPNKIKAMTDTLLEMADAEFKRYAAERLPNIPQPTGFERNQPSSPLTEIVDADKLSVLTKNGKKYYKVHGGGWQLHGVPIWEEGLKASSLNPAEIPDNGMIFSGSMKMKVLMADGKPKKVLKLFVDDHA